MIKFNEINCDRIFISFDLPLITISLNGITIHFLTIFIHLYIEN